MRYKTIRCKYCGDIATVSTMRKENYCDNEDCKKQAHNDNAKKSYSVKVKKTQENKDFNQRVVARKISTTSADNMKTDDIYQLALELGNVRYKLINLIKAEVEKEKKYNKDDDILIHKIEFENLTDEQVVNLVNKIKMDRDERRQTKYRRLILDTMLKNVTIKNPSRFIQAVKIGAKQTRDFKRYLGELQQNEEIFMKKKDGE